MAGMVGGGRRVLAVIALLAGLAAGVNYYIFAVSRTVGQPVWDAVDPVIIVVMAALTLWNLAESVRVRVSARGGGEQRPGQLARDVVTALSAVTTMFYLHNYLLKVVSGVDAANPWIWHFIVPPMVVLLVVEGIAAWGKGKAG